MLKPEVPPEQSRSRTAISSHTLGARVRSLAWRWLRRPPRSHRAPRATPWEGSAKRLNSSIWFQTQSRFSKYFHGNSRVGTSDGLQSGCNGRQWEPTCLKIINCLSYTVYKSLPVRDERGSAVWLVPPVPPHPDQPGELVLRSRGATDDSRLGLYLLSAHFIK